MTIITKKSQITAGAVIFLTDPEHAAFFEVIDWDTNRDNFYGWKTEVDSGGNIIQYYPDEFSFSDLYKEIIVGHNT